MCCGSDTPETWSLPPKSVKPKAQKLVTKGPLQGAFSKPSSSQLLSINLAFNDLLLSSSSTTKVPLEHQQFTPAPCCSRAALSQAAAGPCLCRADPNTHGQGWTSPALLEASLGLPPPPHWSAPPYTSHLHTPPLGSLLWNPSVVFATNF